VGLPPLPEPNPWSDTLQTQVMHVFCTTWEMCTTMITRGKVSGPLLNLNKLFTSKA